MKLLISSCLTTLCAAAAASASDGPEKPSAAWDVSAPPGPTRTQAIEVREGTWMNLDVHPSGEWIAFDLLGELYRLPIEGGDAVPLTSGREWDMQPRFSPDGRTLAFTSDRTGEGDRGGDNLWVMDLEAGVPRQVSAESYRLVNGPAWSPDGQFLVARKHFSSRRSLGAGEMWMYHVSGVAGGKAQGLQLTDRPTDQKDVNEPVFDPSGRYLYYSLDATPGPTFEYDKDSNKQIYVIDRLDLQTQETERLVSGPGGACRPTPSPDGEWLAFVRRVGEKTALFLFDLDSGAVKKLYDGLERDMQEAWAIHGVYPSMAWTPDSKSLVFWAKGRIHRLDVARGAVSEIPFRVQDTRVVNHALRTEIEVAPDEVPLKMLRWVQVCPRGERVVFQTLGRLWLRELESGETRALTRQDEHFEFYPSFSRDGRFLTYVSWDDQDLGAVRVVSVDGEESWRLTREPGHYVDPCFSPDGQHVVYRKIGGGWVTSPAWSRRTGVYVVPARGGEAERIARSGRRPQFGADSSRVFLTRTGGGKDSDQVEFFSIDLKGRDERVHFTSDWATEVAVAPDGEHLAFIERFRVYLAPFVDTGRAVALSPKTASFPVVQASEEAGDFVHFSGDGQRLHWALGPTLSTVDLDACFEALAGGEAPDSAEPRELSLSFSVPHDRPEGVLALVGGRIVTMRGDEILEDGALVIEGNRIVAVGSRDEVEVPAGAFVVDLEGRTVLPGFIDAHAHGAQGSEGLTPQQCWVDYARLAFGVTAVHDPSNDTHEIFAASEATKAGVLVAPRTFSTGTILYGATGNFRTEVDSLEDARFHLRRMQAVGAFSVKSYNQPRRDQRQQVVAAARELGMMVVPEGGSTFMHNLSMVVDGHTNLEHTLPVQTIYQDVRDLWKGTEVGYTPTLNVAYGGLGAENYWYQVDDVWKNERLCSFVPPQVLIPRSRRRTLAPEEDYNHILCAGIARMIVEDGGMATAGGHGQLNGIDTHWEMWAMVQGGMTPMQALRCGTWFGARSLGLGRDLGTLEVGKLADLVVFEPGADPTQDIRQSERIDVVVANGRPYDAKTMNGIGPGAQARQPFFWERDDFGVGVLSIPVRGCQGCGRTGVPSWVR